MMMPKKRQSKQLLLFIYLFDSNNASLILEVKNGESSFIFLVNDSLTLTKFEMKFNEKLTELLAEIKEFQTKQLT
jgi:hypothetical protein